MMPDEQLKPMAACPRVRDFKVHHVLGWSFMSKRSESDNQRDDAAIIERLRLEIELVS